MAATGFGRRSRRKNALRASEARRRKQSWTGELLESGVLLFFFYDEPDETV